MTATATTIWQISGGPASRPFADMVLKHGDALIPPSDAGSARVWKAGWSRRRAT